MARAERAKRAFTANIKTSFLAHPARIRRQDVLAFDCNRSSTGSYRTFHKRLAAEGHELHCQIEDGLDKRPITEDTMRRL